MTIAFAPSPSKTSRRLNGGIGAVVPEVMTRSLEGTHPKYPIENIVFQGGGAKGIIYAGACLGLEELGVAPYLKRFAAASAGCVPALFLALGLNGEQIKKETDELFLNDFFDGAKNVPFGKEVALGRNAFKNLGMHPADKAISHFGDVLERYTGDPDFTFLDLYNTNGRELCFAVSNISRQQSEYCHVNTTPDMPIRRAMRGTMSLPFLWEPIELTEGEKYQDGAVFNNFPLKAFDGWYLSTDKEDSLFIKVGKENPKVFEAGTPQHEVVKAFKDGLYSSFAEPNEKTLGFRVSDEESPDQAAYATFLQELEQRAIDKDSGKTLEKRAAPQLEDIPFPNTKYAKAYLKKKEKELRVFEDSFKFEHAHIEMCTWFIANSDSLTESESGHPHAIDTAIASKLLNKTPPADTSPEIFGYSSWDEVMNLMDARSKGYITRVDQGIFWENYGIRNAYLKNRKPKKITSLGGLAGEVLNSIILVAEEGLLRDPNNAKRICSLNTKYIALLSLEMELADKQFLYELGKRDTIAWIKDRYD